MRERITDRLEPTTAFFGPNILPSIPEQATPHSSCSVERSVNSSTISQSQVGPSRSGKNRGSALRRSADEDAAALRNWSEKLAEQRRIQNRLAGMLLDPSKRLGILYSKSLCGFDFLVHVITVYSQPFIRWHDAKLLH